MLPSILPGSEVTAILTDARRVRRGDVIWYPGEHNKMILHRVVRIREDEQGIWFVVRGDAQTWSEEIPSSAVACRAVRVKYGPLSYTTDGIVGNAIARLAVRRGMVWRAAIRVARASARLAVFAKAAFRTQV